MATTKVKGTTKKIKELRGEKATKIKPEELGEVQSVVNKINQSHLELGQLESRKHGILHYIAGVQDEMTLLQNRFQDKYGTPTINIETGAITYEDEQTYTQD